MNKAGMPAATVSQWDMRDDFSPAGFLDLSQGWNLIFTG
jgi:hypothetical protein